MDNKLHPPYQDLYMSKYYTPDISDLFVGYECEFLEDPSQEKWTPFVFKNISSEPEHGWSITMSSVRTPYLTKEQIEKEGWEETENNYVRVWGGYSFKKRNMSLRFSPTEGLLIINIDFSRETTHPMGYPDDSMFKGKCPSINEFRKICKLLGI